MRRALILITAFALALRCLLPAGVMLSTAPSGQPELVLCTGHGPLRVHVDSHGKIVPDKPSKSQRDTLCPFSAVGAVAFFAMPAVLLAEQRVSHVAYVLAAVPSRPAFPPAAASPRGPPSDLS